MSPWRASRRKCPLSAKRKTLELFNKDVGLAATAEDPPPDLVVRHGQPLGIYSREINYWLWQVAVDLLKTRPDLGLIYVHTTDYPMHRWPPEAPESQEHLQRIDALIGEARAAARDAAFFITAGHGMNFKTRCWEPPAPVPCHRAVMPSLPYRNTASLRCARLRRYGRRPHRYQA